MLGDGEMRNKERLLVVVLVFTASATCWAKEKPLPQLKADKVAVAKGNNAFALDLYARLRQKKGNLFLSPYSISTALAMTYAGARGETEAQMAKVLHFTLPQGRLHPAMGTLVRELNAGGKKQYRLIVANALWGQKGYGFLPAFLSVNEKYYGAGLEQVDFAHDPNGSRKTINTWVEKQTQGKIKDLLKPPHITPLTTLVLTNAIYFKGNWAAPFDKKHTRNEPFTVKAGKKVETPMMHKTDEFGYMEERDFQILELPYVGNELSMLVLLPRRLDGLADLEKSLTTRNLLKWPGQLRKREIILAVPKFKMTSEFELGKTLKSMGMANAFSGAADFSGMTGRRDLFISEVVHKAFVEVNEEGTEAAAATAVVMKRGPAPQIAVFRADHPFLFLIRDNRSNSILFIGRVENPKS